MSAVKAITDDIIIATKIASFYPLDEKAKKEIVSKIADVMTEMGQKHNFIVWRVSMGTQGVNND